MKHSSDENVDYMIRDLLVNKKELEANNCKLYMELKKKDALIEKYKAALEFYGQMENWSEIDGTDGVFEQIRNDSYNHTNGYSIGGKRARQALAESESK